MQTKPERSECWTNNTRAARSLSPNQEIVSIWRCRLTNLRFLFIKMSRSHEKLKIVPMCCGCVWNSRGCMWFIRQYIYLKIDFTEILWVRRVASCKCGTSTKSSTPPKPVGCICLNYEYSSLMACRLCPRTMQLAVSVMRLPGWLLYGDR